MNVELNSKSNKKVHCYRCYRKIPFQFIHIQKNPDINKLRKISGIAYHQKLEKITSKEAFISTLICF